MAETSLTEKHIHLLLAGDSSELGRMAAYHQGLKKGFAGWETSRQEHA